MDEAGKAGSFLAEPALSLGLLVPLCLSALSLAVYFGGWTMVRCGCTALGKLHMAEVISAQHSAWG